MLRAERGRNKKRGRKGMIAFYEQMNPAEDDGCLCQCGAQRGDD
jgi:hypothetical protein